MPKAVTNQITFIGQVSIKNYNRLPRLITVIAQVRDSKGWDKFGRGYRGDVLDGTS